MATTQGIKLDDTTTERLKMLASQRKRTAHWLMREAIADYLEREERYEREKQEDQARWENYVLTGRAIPEAEAEARLRALITNTTDPTV